MFKTCILGSWDKTLRLWDLATGKTTRRLVENRKRNLNIILIHLTSVFNWGEILLIVMDHSNTLLIKYANYLESKSLAWASSI